MPPIGDSQLGDLLRSGVKVWNAKRPPGWVNLADLDFDDLDLRSAYLSNAGMWGFNRRGSDLSDVTRLIYRLPHRAGATLIGTSVQGTNFVRLGSTERRFTTDRLKQIHRTMVSIVFDFEKPRSKDLTESVTLWARMCALIIVDLTHPASAPHELASIVPSLPSVPVFPIISDQQQPYAMFEHLLRYPRVRKPLEFVSDSALESVVAEIVARLCL